MRGGSRVLLRTATKLGRRAARRYPPSSHRALPNLWFLSDPMRTPDPATIAARLPRGSAVIYRAFGQPGALDLARTLRLITRRRGILLLIGADTRLARQSGADGVHLPERRAHHARWLRLARPDWLVTAAAHGLAAGLRAKRFGAQAVLVSAVFPSRSPSADRPLGVLRFEAIARSIDLPVIALGGLGDKTASRLGRSRAAGLAAVEAFQPSYDVRI